MLKTRLKKAAIEPKEPFGVPKSQVVRKTSIKPTLKKALATKKVARQSIKSSSKSIPVNDDDPVVTLLPSASLRLLEKVNLYKIWYQETLPLQVTSSARFFGYLFIGLGTIFAASSHLMHTELPPGMAALVCSTGVCQEVPDASLPTGAPQISFLNTLPKEIKSDLEFTIKAENTESLQVVLTNVQTGLKSELKSAAQAEFNNFQYRIAIADLSHGDYKIEAIAEAKGIEYVFSGSVFSYQSVEPPLKPIAVVEATVDMDVGGVEQTASSTASSTDTSASTLEPEAQQPVSLKFEQNAEASYLVITTGDFLPSRVNVYSRIDQSKPEVYLGQAYLVQNQWFFSLSAINLPQVSQQFLASFEVDGVTKKTKAVVVSYSNTKPQTFDMSEDFLIKNRKVDLTLQALNKTNEDRTLYYTNNALDLRDESDLQFVNEKVVAEIDATLETEEQILDAYFFHYSVAYLGGQSFLVNLAKQEIDSYATLLASKIAEDTSDLTLAPAVETILLARFSRLTNIIEPLEDKLIVETNTLIKQDSDNDGISDYDELTNFFTNPTSPDTDQDGVIDSVEVLHRTNPLIPDLQAFPQLTQNQAVLSASEILFVNKSKAIVLETDSALPKQTQYSIEGKGIPSTFVYLLDKTNNTVGLIKTSASGEFFYTIDQPALLGLSTIQAAIVDSNGKLVSVSAEYHYANQSNKLMAAASEVLLGDEELSTRLTSFNILTGSIALVALGFILLFLVQGIGVHRRNIALKSLDFAVKQ